MKIVIFEKATNEVLGLLDDESLVMRPDIACIDFGNNEPVIERDSNGVFRIKPNCFQMTLDTRKWD